MLSVCKTKAGKKFTVENILSSEEGKKLYARLNRKVSEFVSEANKEGEDLAQIIKFIDNAYKSKIGNTLFHKVSTQLTHKSPFSTPPALAEVD